MMLVRAKIKDKEILGEWNEKIYGTKLKSVYLNNEPYYFEEEEDFCYEEISPYQYYKELFFEELKDCPSDIASFFKSLSDEFYKEFGNLLSNVLFYIRNEEDVIRKIISSELPYVKRAYMLYAILEFFEMPDEDFIEIQGNIIIDKLHLVKVKVLEGFIVEELFLQPPAVREDLISCQDFV